MLGASAAKKYGGKLTLLIAVMLWSFSTFITPYFAHSKASLIALRVLLGIGEGLGMIHMCSVHILKRRKFYLQLLNFEFGDKTCM